MKKSTPAPEWWKTPKKAGMGWPMALTLITFFLTAAFALYLHHDSHFEFHCFAESFPPPAPLNTKNMP